jgi:hypothetical protein
MVNHNRTPQLPRPGANHHDFALCGYRVGMGQLSHVMASVCRLLHVGNMSAMGGVGGTRGSRFGKSSGGQTKDQKQIKDALYNLSVHRVMSP